MKPVVLKFGGSSLADPERIARAVAIVHEAAAAEPVAVVVSALAGVTDELDALVAAATARRLERAARVEALRRRHRAALEAVAPGPEGEPAAASLERWLGWLDARLAGIERLGACTAGARAVVLGVGERLSAPLFAAALRAAGTGAEAWDAGALIATGDDPLDAEPDLDLTRRRMRWLAPGRGRVPVLTGFVGSDAAGNPTVLGRGGSDLTATVLGAALGASRIELWTDVDGVLSADPARVPHAHVLRRLSFGEARALAAHGARVLHPRCIGPAMAAGIPIVVRNTLRPEARGTWIGPALGGAGTVRAVAGRAADDGQAWIAAVGAGIEAVPELRTIFLETLAGVTAPLEVADAGASLGAAVADPPEPDALAARIPAADLTAAVTAVHERLVRRPRAIALVVAGATGRVARALRQSLAEQEPDLAARTGIELRLVGVSNRARMSWSREGIAPLEVERALEDGEPRDRGRFLERLRAARNGGLVFVDCTASEEPADDYAALLGAGVAVVTPNKRANARPLAFYRALREAARLGHAPYRYSTTVGAGLPILETLRGLARRGDPLRSLAGVVSGTLSFVLGRVSEGAAFSAAVAEAHRAGLTEPHPADDLSGEDVARKLVILLREAAIEIERDDVGVESLIPPALAGEPDPARFLAGLAAADDAWSARAAAARTRGERLTYVARFDGVRPAVGVEYLAADSPLARTRPGENVFVVHSLRTNGLPITIRGPGAGPEFTAAGVLSDVLEAAAALVRE